MNRRVFARSLSKGIASVAVLPSLARASLVASGEILSLGILSLPRKTSFLKGVGMGVDEAQRTAALFRKKIVARPVRVEPGTGIEGMIANFEAMRVQAVIACADDALLRDASRACERLGIALVDCGSRSDSLRRSSCEKRTFYVEASDAMYAGAAKQVPSAARIALWDSRLEKYGAAQLNDRFRQYAGRPMDPGAWAGWIAVKIVSESFLHSPGSVVDWMISDRAEFDGHKGAPLSFRSWDHQLRQPLYAVSDRVTDIPDISRSSTPLRELLDTLGDRAGVQSCIRPGQR